MVKTVNKVTLSKTSNKKKPIKEKDNVKIKTPTKAKNKIKTKDKNDNPNAPLELPPPSIMLQIPLTGDVQNLFWVLPYSTNNKVNTC